MVARLSPSNTLCERLFPLKINAFPDSLPRRRGSVSSRLPLAICSRSLCVRDSLCALIFVLNDDNRCFSLDPAQLTNPFTHSLDLPMPCVLCNCVKGVSLKSMQPKSSLRQNNHGFFSSRDFHVPSL